ncbi:MAG: ParB/RepB/Spo0J family partition protein [Planctomycetota bacterium]
MYRRIKLDLLSPHPECPRRMCRRFAKKLRANIEQIGFYETITVRPHPTMARKFEVLNGHARVEALRALGIPKAKCDIWDLSDDSARLFLAAAGKLSGSNVPVLRMGLLQRLLENHSREELATQIPETQAKLEHLAVPPLRKTSKDKTTDIKPGTVIMEFYLTSAQHAVVSAALTRVSKKHSVRDSAAALARIADIYLAQAGVSPRRAPAIRATA